MFGSKSAQFDRYLERATSQLLLEPDWDSILQICDAIRQNDVQSKYAVNQMARKVKSENPHVTMFALQVLESVVKNCGSSIHEEVASKEFMDFLKEQIKKRNDPVKSKVLELIQVWSHAFRNEPSYKIVQDTFHLLKMEEYQFPALKEADAMFMAEKAPEWKDGETCHRCRVQFSTFQRKHHCRNCGQVFCSKCSSKNSIIPRFGIEREVRVCDACFDTLNKTAAGSSSGKKEDDLPAEYLSSPLSQQPQQAPAKKSEQELQEEEELQLALALSMSEAQEKEKLRERMRPGFTGGSSNNSSPAPAKDTNNMYSGSQSSQKLSGPTGLDTSDMDPELARYLNRNYWEQKQEEIKTSSTQPSAPIASGDKENNKEQENYHQNGENGSGGTTTSSSGPPAVIQSDPEEAQFLSALNSSIQIFVNRMKSNSMRGRSIANDSSVQTLFMTLNTMHPQLMTYIQKQEDSRAYYESLQDKLAQLKDAREALNDLREEHNERRRREQEELERQRQVAMAARLEKLRQKKQEYLEYQRQLAMQRMQEQEREMAMRLEQQKHMQQMRAMQYVGGMPQQQPQMQQMYPGAGAPGFAPPGSAEGSPHHQPQYAAAGGAGGPQYQQQYPGAPPPQGYPPYQPQQQQQQQPPPMQQYPVTTAPPPQDYNPYNMQGMMTSLPGAPPMQGQPPQQQAPPHQQYAPPPQGMPPQQGIPQQQQQQQQQQPQQQQPQQQQQQNIDQLICFD